MSKIEVNTIEPQCGTTLTVGAAGTNVTVPSNVVKSNALQASDAGNIIKQCGTTITLGATGDAITLASGASQSGFGREGSVDWDTASIKTGTFSAVSGNGYFVNTAAAISTVNLPAGAAGSIVAISDYTRTFATYNCTVAPNGAEKIGGIAADATLDANGQSATFIYVDGTEGWINVQETQTSVTGVADAYITATGGTPCSGAIVCTNYKTHTFTGPGTFSVSAGSGALAKADYMVVAGGGGGGGGRGGGGGAGGFRESNGTSSGCYTTSPLGTTPTTVPALTLTPGAYPIAIGAGGGAGVYLGALATEGGVSTFSTVPSAGGGRGGGETPCVNGSTGGSGGASASCGPFFAGNTPPVTPPQGNNSGTGGGCHQGGGGGGAGSVGGSSPTFVGGTGVTTCISATPTAYAGGGGSGSNAGASAGSPCGTGGAGSASPAAGTAGTTNTGGAGGGGRGTGSRTPGGLGGSGIVIVRYKFQ